MIRDKYANKSSMSRKYYIYIIYTRNNILTYNSYEEVILMIIKNRQLQCKSNKSKNLYFYIN